MKLYTNFVYVLPPLGAFAATFIYSRCQYPVLLFVPMLGVLNVFFYYMTGGFILWVHGAETQPLLYFLLGIIPAAIGTGLGSLLQRKKP